MSSIGQEQNARVSPPTDSNIRVIAVTTTSQVVDIREYGKDPSPTGQSKLTIQADGCDLYICLTSNAAGVVSAATLAAPGSTAVGGNALPGMKIANGVALTIHHTATLSLYIVVVGSASGYMRYWRSSRIGAT